MSQFILDEQLAASEIAGKLSRYKLRRLPDLRPGELVLDERIPEILRHLNQPTFLTIDKHFCRSDWCNPHYCVIYFALRDQEQELMPDLLKALLRLPGFKTRAQRMGKVIRVGRSRIDYWEFPSRAKRSLPWDHC